MILYRHPSSPDQPTPIPAWLDGAPLTTVSTGTHHLVGIVDPWHCGDRAGWQPVADGWEAVITNRACSRLLGRTVTWARTRPVADADGNEWLAPVALSAQGHPALTPRYGADWLPVWTPAQTRLLEIAQAATTAFQGIDPTRDVVELPIAAVQWAAEALAAANYITLDDLRTFALIDQVLLLSTLAALTGLADVVAADQDPA